MTGQAKQHKSNDAMMVAIDQCTPEDFDGHTDFDKLTFEQKLDWIAMSARFYFEHGASKSDDA